MATASDVPPPLTGSRQPSFAYTTIKDRLPLILAKVVDTAHRRRHDLIATHGPSAGDDIKAVVAQLSQLRYEMMTDKPIKPLNTKRSDADDWKQGFDNKFTKCDADVVSWFKSSWLFVECYMYRKIAEILENSQHLHDWDPFEMQKEQAFVGSLPAIQLLGQHINQLVKQKHSGKELKDVVLDLMQISLWGNKYDLSISAGEQITDEADHSPLHCIHKFRDHIVMSQLDAAADALLRDNPDKKPIHIVMDNVGMEQFSDLCMAEYLLAAGLTDKVIFHVKMIPWFVSDVTPHDFNWTLEILRGSQCVALNELAHRWHARVDEGTFEVRTHHFWTSWHPFTDMPSSAPDLYAGLSSAHFVFIKGDLNYRKLVNDLNWDPTTPYSKALIDFHPAPHVSLRTLKADVVVGLEPGQRQKMDERDAKWMVTGDYAVISFDNGPA